MIIGSGPHTLLSADPGGGKLATNGPSPLPGLASALLTAIVESSDDAIASKTLDGIVTSWNHAAERLFGYTAEEMIGRPISILAAPGRESEMPAILERIRHGERVDHFDTVRRRKDGTLVEVSLTVSPVRDEARPDRRRLEDRPRHQRATPGGAGTRAALRRAPAPGEEPAGHGPGAGPPDRDRGPLGRAVPRRPSSAGSRRSRSRTSWRSGRRPAPTWPRSSVAPWSPTRATADGGDDRGRAAGDAGRGEGPGTRPGAARARHQRGQARRLVDRPRAGCGSAGRSRRAMGRRLRLRWEERGGPQVEPPAARGFGTTLIQYAAAGELGGPAELTFAPEGLEAGDHGPARLGPFCEEMWCRRVRPENHRPGGSWCWSWRTSSCSRWTSSSQL